VPLLFLLISTRKTCHDYTCDDNHWQRVSRGHGFVKGNESYRFRHSAATTKSRIKAREQSKKGGAAGRDRAILSGRRAWKSVPGYAPQEIPLGDALHGISGALRRGPVGDTLRLGFDGGDGFKTKFHEDGSRPHVTSAKKAKALKFGGLSRKRANHLGLPVRRLLGFLESDQQLVADVAVDHLTAVLDRVR
jgi:hypothetical protein